MRPLLHIVPRLPPAIDGVGDYAAVLAARLRDGHGVAERFLVTDDTWRADAASPPCAVLEARTAEALAAALAGSDAAGPLVLLHYVNYAYHGRGCPTWLVDGLEHWRRGHADRRLVVMFHELFASGPPWRSEFWLAPVQRRLARRLAVLADAAFTSIGRYADQLAAWRPRGPAIPTWPVLSNVGEPETVPGHAQREPSLAVFGRLASRIGLYQRNLPALAGLCRDLGLRVIHDIGQPLPAGHLPRIDGVEIRVHGALPPAGISALLSRTATAFVDNGGGALAKSGVFAAYCSHGVAPICCKAYPAEDGLLAGREYVVAGQPFDQAALAAAAGAAFGWYRRHCTAALARAVVDLAQSLEPDAGRVQAAVGGSVAR